MANTERTPGVVEGRLGAEALARNFGDLHEPLDAHEAMVAADRCYFCYDAPCITACPTSIDIPLFIRQIQADQPEGAARTIFDQNILGGMCARVCPTETLCEEACVREAAEGKPVEIGRLQRFATDTLMAKPHPYARAPETGKKIAIAGAGPAGLACAHRLAMYGHKVVMFEARSKPGGLNEYGIASYKTVDDFAQAEVDWLLSIGGIEMVYDHSLGQGDLTLDALTDKYDAVFLALGLSGVNALRAEGEEHAHVRDAVDFISELRQAANKATVPVGRDVVVIGGGMTAVDAAVQSKLLGAENVTMVYRRPRERMSASEYELHLATSKGVRIITGAAPTRLMGDDHVTDIEFAYTEDGPNGLQESGETFTLKADQVLKAIGQHLDGAPGVITLDGGKIAVDESGRTSLPKVWAGGDCAAGGDDLTVTAVAEGRDAAEDIHAAITG